MRADLLGQRPEAQTVQVLFLLPELPLPAECLADEAGPPQAQIERDPHQGKSREAGRTSSADQNEVRSQDQREGEQPKDLPAPGPGRDDADQQEDRAQKPMPEHGHIQVAETQ